VTVGSIDNHRKRYACPVGQQAALCSYLLGAISGVLGGGVFA
jgi:hypothetical protein